MAPRLIGCAALALALSAACGGDSGGADAAPIDGARPDAEELCPGELTVEVRVSDLASGDNLFDVQVAATADPGRATTSAPNGRAVLCVERADEVDVTAGGDDVVERTDRIARTALGKLRAAGAVHPFAMITAGHLADLATALDVAPPDAGTTWLLAHAVRPDGSPALGATLASDGASDGSFTRAADGTFAGGDAIAEGGAILVANLTATAPIGLTVEPPAGQTCDGPANLSPAAGAISGAVFVCQE
jgi:hypothetical protein